MLYPTAVVILKSRSIFSIFYIMSTRVLGVVRRKMSTGITIEPLEEHDSNVRVKTIPYQKYIIDEVRNMCSL